MTVSSLIACSGPGAGQAIAAAIRYGYISAGFTLILLLATATLYIAVRHNFLAAACCLSPMLIHPAWTISAIHGDCGFRKVMLSDIFIGLAVSLLVLSLVIVKTRGRVPRHAAQQ